MSSLSNAVGRLLSLPGCSFQPPLTAKQEEPIPILLILKKMGIIPSDMPKEVTITAVQLSAKQMMDVEDFWVEFEKLKETHLPITLYVAKVLKLTKTLLAKDTEFRTDDTIYLNNFDIIRIPRAYRKSLALESPLLKDLLKSEDKSELSMTKETFELLLKALTSNKPISIESVQILLPIALGYQLNRVEEKCEKTFFNWIENHSEWKRLKKTFPPTSAKENFAEKIHKIAQSIPENECLELRKKLSNYLCIYITHQRATEEIYETLKLLNPEKIILIQPDMDNVIKILTLIPTLKKISVIPWKTEGFSDSSEDILDNSVNALYAVLPNDNITTDFATLKYLLPNLEILSFNLQRDFIDIPNEVLKYFDHLKTLILRSSPTHCKISDFKPLKYLKELTTLQLTKLIFEKNYLLNLASHTSLKEITISNCTVVEDMSTDSDDDSDEASEKRRNSKLLTEMKNEFHQQNPNIKITIT